MKKILYITNLPAPYKVACFNILGKWTELTVLYERKYATNRNKKWKNPDEYRSFDEHYLKGVEIGNESSFDPEIIKYLKKYKFDMILLNGYSSPTAILAIIYMKIYKIKFGIICDGLLPSNNSILKNKLKKFLISSAEFWMSSGKMTTKILEQYGANSEKIYLYPFSSVLEDDIIIEDYDKTIYKSKIGCKEKKMILYVGHFIYEKGYDILLEVFHDFDGDIRLFMVGGENTKSNIQKQDEKITIIDFKTKKELADYYKAADLFILPTKGDVWGLVVNEAMACGLPIITTDKCGAGLELIKNGENGYLIPSENIYCLRKIVTDIIQEDDLLKKMGKKNLELAKRYTIEKMAKSIYEVLQLFDR